MYVRVGQIVGAFGIRGQVKVLTLTEFVDRFQKGSQLRLNDNPVEVLEYTEHKGQIILRLAGVKDRNTAEALQWQYLEAPAQARPDLDEDEYYTEDLIGMTVETVAGEKLGVVGTVLEAPAQDVLVVGEILIPAVKQFVKRVDIKSRVITVELIPGMRPGEE